MNLRIYEISLIIGQGFMCYENDIYLNDNVYDIPYY